MWAAGYLTCTSKHVTNAAKRPTSNFNLSRWQVLCAGRSICQKGKYDEWSYFWPKKGFLVPKKELQRDSPVAVLTPEHTNLKSSRFFYRRKEKYWALMNLDRLPWRLLPSYAPSFHEICWKRSLSSAQSPHFFLVRSASFLDCLYNLQLLVALRDFVCSRENDGFAWFSEKIWRKPYLSWLDPKREAQLWNGCWTELKSLNCVGVDKIGMGWKISKIAKIYGLILQLDK